MNNPDPLSSVLKTWKHDPKPAPGFSQAVWTRIDTPAPTFSFAQLLHFPGLQPLAASVAVLLAVLAGTGAGLALNHTRATDQMAAAYVRSIDPLQMTSLPSSHSHS